VHHTGPGRKLAAIGQGPEWTGQRQAGL